MIHLKNELEECDGGTSPRSSGEIRGPLNIECKMSSSQMQEDIDSQLRANMLLSVCSSFYEMVLKTPPLSMKKCLSDLKKLTCYGITFGTTTMLVIYKLIVDFSTRSLIYEERFRYPDSPISGHLINCGLAGIAHCIYI